MPKEIVLNITQTTLLQYVEPVSLIFLTSMDSIDTFITVILGSEHASGEEVKDRRFSDCIIKLGQELNLSMMSCLKRREIIKNGELSHCKYYGDTKIAFIQIFY